MPVAAVGHRRYHQTEQRENNATKKCVICKHGETEPGTVTVTLERGGATLVFKNVPAQVCANCGEAYLDEEHTARLLERANAAAQGGVQAEVREYVAA